MDEVMKDFLSEIEDMEAELCRKRHIYYHLQTWVHTGIIKDEKTLITVSAYCEVYYPELDWAQCYEKAMKAIQTKTKEREL